MTDRQKLKCPICKEPIAFTVRNPNNSNSAEAGDIILKGQMLLIKPRTGKLVLKCRKCKNEVEVPELVLVREGV